MQSFSQVRLAMCPNIKCAEHKNTALITLLLIQYKGEDWYCKNIFEPYYIQRKAGRYSMAITYDGFIQLNFSESLPSNVRNAYRAIARIMEQEHYTIYKAATEVKEALDSLQYVNIIKFNYTTERRSESNRGNSPLFNVIGYVNPIITLECLDYYYYLNNNHSDQISISMFEYVKSKAIYYYIQVINSSLTEGINLQDIITEIDHTKDNYIDKKDIK